MGVSPLNSRFQLSFSGEAWKIRDILSHRHLQHLGRLNWVLWILELTENPLKNGLSPTIGWFSTHFSGRKPPNSPTEGRLTKIQNGRFTRKSSTCLRQHPNFQCCINIPGWWLSLPLWKMMEWKSVGMMTFPIYGKIIHSCSKPPTRYIGGGS